MTSITMSLIFVTANVIVIITVHHLQVAILCHHYSATLNYAVGWW